MSDKSDTPRTEHDDALWIAGRVLDRPWGDPDDDLAILARQLLRANERLADANAAKERAEALIYVPGVWTCAKCKLSLVSATMNAQTGLVKANTEPQQCPNGCGPLWRKTERDAGNELVDRLEKSEARVKVLEEALTRILNLETRLIQPWTHETAADEYARVLDATRVVARAALAGQEVKEDRDE